MIIRLPFEPNTEYVTTQTFAEHVARAQTMNTPYNGAIDYFFPQRPVGTPILAAHDGRVDKVYAQMDGYGNAARVLSPEGYATLYAHCDSLNVRLNDWVTAGETIAYSGWTGNVWDGDGQKTPAAAHLHFELRDPKGAPVDPALYFAKVQDNKPVYVVAQYQTLGVSNIRVKADLDPATIVGRLPLGWKFESVGTTEAAGCVWLMVQGGFYVALSKGTEVLCKKLL